MTTTTYKFPTVKGETTLSVNIPANGSADCVFEVIANGGPSFFNIHREHGGAGKGVFIVTMLASNGNVLATIDGQTPEGSRSLGSNAPHFQHVGLPKHTASTTDKELAPGVYTYRISAPDGKAYTGVDVGRMNGANT
jgi:hypothetical protein